MQESRKSNTPVIVMIGDKRIGRIRQYTVKCTRPLEDICTAGDPWPAARLPMPRPAAPKHKKAAVSCS